MTRILRGVALVFLAACAGSDAATPDALPTVVTLSPDGVRQESHSYSPDGKRIAYWSPASDSTASWQLWVANADLSAPTKVPVTSTITTPPVWSPEGARLAATSRQFGLSDVVVVTLATGDVKRMTQGPGVEIPLGWQRNGQLLSYYGTSPDGSMASGVISMATGANTPLVAGETRPVLGTPSPDGSHVAYYVIDGSKTTIWVADSNGANRRQLTTEGFEVLERYNEWSPDGTALLYESRRTGTLDLWIVPIDGGKPRQLTRNVRNESEGAWSPDGKWVAFISDRGRQTDVWIVPAAGGEERRVTNTAAEEVAPLQWRSGSNELTFGVRSQRNGVWALDLADGKERRLSPDSVRIGQFWMSPDGTQTNYVIERGGGVRDLAVTPIAGGAPRVLVSGDATIESPRWSPDGSKIVYASDRSGTADIWVVDAAGGPPRELVNWPGSETCPMWSGDGSVIYFVSDHETRMGDVWKVAPAGGEPTRVSNLGSVYCIDGRADVSSIFATTISPRGGQISLTRIRDDGSMQVVWDHSNLGRLSIFPSGDSIAALVEQPDGKGRSMILASSGSGGRVFLKPHELISNVSYDGKFALYETSLGGETDLHLLSLVDGVARRLTSTPEEENGAEFTRDGKSIVFRRELNAWRIHAVDLGKILTQGAR